MALLKRKRSGLHDPMTVVTNFVNACNRHDSEGVSSCLHPDFDSIQPMYPSRNFRGADQVRRNWQAIFDAEPGFRLTVLRSSAAGDTVWLELHGAGRDAEVAGVFVMGVENDRIRWARIYSALVDDAPAATSDDGSLASAQLRPVPPLPDESEWSQGATITPAPPVDEDLIAPVVEIDGKGRARRGQGDGEPEPAVAAEVATGDGLIAAEPVPDEAGDGPVAAEPVPDEPARPVVEGAAVDEPTSEEPVPDEPRAPSNASADSIDPESLVDTEHLTAADGTVEPDVVADPARATLPGAEYDFKEDKGAEATTAVEVIATEPAPMPEIELPVPEAEVPEIEVPVPEVPETGLPVTDVPETGLSETGLPETEVMVETMVEVPPGAVFVPEEAAEPEPQFFVEPAFVEPEGPSAAEAAAEARPGLIVTTPPPAPPARTAATPKGKKRKPPRWG